MDGSHGGRHDAESSSYVVGWVSGGYQLEGAVGTGGSFLRKYAAAGNVAWTRQFDSPTRAVAGTPSGDLFIAGSVSTNPPEAPYPMERDAVVARFGGTGFVPVPHPLRLRTQCLESGWTNLVGPYSFKNVGKCVSFVSAGH